MKKHYTSKTLLVGEEDFPAYSLMTGKEAWETVYLASEVDEFLMANIRELNKRHARIADLERGMRAAMKWMHRNVAADVEAKTAPSGDGFSADYLNDLADMRKALRSL